MNEKKEWWEYLDWSTMKLTFDQLPEETQKRILEKAYWSLGKGKFVEET